MNWRNPKDEMPKQGQAVWVMLEPHKNRGSLLESAASIEIVCGEATYSDSGKCRIDNYDELGMGAIGWQLGGKPDYSGWADPYAIAWLPVEEMSFPDWK